MWSMNSEKKKKIHLTFEIGRLATETKSEQYKSGWLYSMYPEFKREKKNKKKQNRYTVEKQLGLVL